MRRKRGSWRRACALLLAAALLAGAPPLTPCARAVGGARVTLQSVAFSAGLADLEFAADHASYMLTLGPDESSCVFMPEPRDEAALVTMLVDGEETPPNTAVEVAPGQRRTVRFEVRAEADGVPNVYTYTLYRTRAALALRIGEVRDSTVDLSLVQTGEADLRTLQVGFGFDPAQLRLTDEDAYRAVTPAEGMGYWGSTEKKNPLMLDEAGTVLDNSAGTVLLSLCGNEELPSDQGVYHAADGTALLTFHFTLAEGMETVDSGAFRLGVAGAPRYGASAMEVPVLGSGTPVAAFRLGFENEPHTLMRPLQSAHGSVRVRPDKPTYAEGETVTVTAEPEAGYVFSRWRANSHTTALVGGTAALYRDTLTLTMNGDVDLSSLRAEFGRPDDATPSGAVLDFSEPYEGDHILAYNPPYGASASISAGAPRALQSAAEEHTPGELEFREPKPTIEGRTSEQFAVDGERGVEAVGDRRTFQTRNTGVKDSGAADAWTAKPFTLRAQTARLNVWLADGDAAGLTEAQLQDLGRSFAESLDHLEAACGAAYDIDGGGRLDILLYDIPDSYMQDGQYTMGLTNPYELYGLVGNKRDVVHLDTWPTVEKDQTLAKVKSTMAHEAQHLVMDYTFRERVAGLRGQAKADRIDALLPPAWVNEGLSMAAEHTLFGPLQNRISLFNTASVLADGFSLTDNRNLAECYPLPYLFFQYVKAQGGQEAIEAFYALDYGVQDDEALMMSVLSGIPAFEGMKFADIVQAFYLALVLHEREGLYGFGTSADLDGVSPQLRVGMSGTVASGGASLLRETWFSPVQQNALRYVGVTLPEVAFTVGEGAHGTTDRTGAQPAARGERVRVEAFPDEGYVFSHWEGDVSAQEARRNPIELTMGRSRSIAPVFTENVHVISFPALSDAHGAVTVTDEEGLPVVDGQAVPHGAVLTVEAIPEEGYWFDVWEDGTAEASRTVTVCEALLLDAPVFWKAEPVEPAALVVGAETADIVDGRFHITLDDGTHVEVSAADGSPLTALVTGMWVRLSANSPEGLRCLGWQTAQTRSAGSQLEASPVVRLRAGTAYRPMLAQAAVVGEGFARLAMLSLAGAENRELAPSEAARLDPDYPAGADGFDTAVADYVLELLSTEQPVTLQPVLAPGLRALWRVNDGVETPVIRIPNSETQTKPFTAVVTEGDVLTITVSDPSGALREAAYTITVRRRAFLPDDIDKGDPRMSLTVSWDSAVQGYVLTGTAAALTANAVQFTLYARSGSLIYAGPDAPPLTLTPSEGFAPAGKCVVEHAARIVNGVPYDRITVAVDSARGGAGVELADGAEFVRVALPAAADFIPKNDLLLPETLAVHGDQPSVEGGTSAETEYSAVAYDTGAHGVYFTAALDFVSSVSGTLLAYNPAPGLFPTVRLADSEGTVYDGAAVLEPVPDGDYAFGRRTFRFNVAGVPAGTYTLTLGKPGHANYIVRGIAVPEDGFVQLADLHDTNGAPLGALALPAGDLDGDGTIRLSDKALLRAALGRRTEQAVDLNGDGIVGLADHRLLMLPENYGRGTVTVTVQAS